MPNIFTRFPVASVQGVIVPILIALVPVFGWTEGASGAVNTALLALGGVVAALGVSVDAALPLLTGAAKAVVAAVLAFGVHVPEVWQAAGLSVLSILVASWTHTQVTAKQPAPLQSWRRAA
jgi:heme exporter protein D